MRAGIVFGFHGCEREVAQKAILNREPITPSNNAYDWLGNGIYFWENDPVGVCHYIFITVIIKHLRLTIFRQFPIFTPSEFHDFLSFQKRSGESL